MLKNIARLINIEANVINKNIQNVKTQNKFYYKNRGYLATIGRSKAIVDFGWFTLKGRIGWIFWSFIHIYFLIGFRNRFMVFANWVLSSNKRVSPTFREEG